MLITVSIPYFRCQPYIRKAVESILAQTHHDLLVIVVNDGDDQAPWGELAHIDDPRLIRFDLKANQGRYFADAVVLNTIDSPYFAVQDSDDWSEPQRLAVLLRALREAHADVAVSSFLNLNERGKSSAQHALSLILNEKLKHRLSHYGLFRTDALRRIGGYYGGFRLGYDTLLMNLLLMTGRVIQVDQVLYNRQYREDSLSNAPLTGIGSPVRRKSTRRLQHFYSESYRSYCAYLNGKLSALELADAIRQRCEYQVTPDDRAALGDASARLKALLEAHSYRLTPLRRVAPPKSRQASISARSETRLTELLHSPHLSWNDWAISKTVAVEVFHRLHSLKPKRILEIGSGVSTLFLAEAAAEIGAQFTVLEHEPFHHRRIDQLLEQYGLQRSVDLILSPLTQHPYPSGEHYFWYEAALSGKFDFVFVDGPPQKYGRQAALFALSDHLAPAWELWMHDAHRAHERSCIALWNAHFTFSSALYDLDEKGVWLLSSELLPTTLVVPPPLAGKVGISILTGRRPGMLKQMVKSLQDNAADLIERSYVLVLVNGRDPEIDAYLETLPFINQIMRHTGDVLPIGAATTRPMQELSHRAEYLIHLEDDWCISSLNSTWVETAASILDAHPGVGQVRLRHCGENVLPQHMITRKPIHWRKEGDVLVADQAHFTFSPHMLRSRDVPKVYPCRMEAEAQRHFVAAGLATAQLSPGIFRHVGQLTVCAGNWR